MKSMINKIKNNMNNLIKNNIILILLITGGILSDLLLRAMTTGFTLYWKPIVTSISMIIFFSILSFFLPYKRRNTYYIVLSTLIGVINAINFLYYRFYNSFVSLSIFEQIKQLSDLGDGISKSIMDISVIIFAIPTIALVAIIKKLNKVNYFEEREAYRRKGEMFKAFVLGTSLLAIVATTLTSTDLSRLVKQWNRPYLVEQLGIYSYTVADIIKNTFTPKITTLPEEEVDYVLSDLIDDNINSQIENEYKDIFKGKDVYVIHYESAQSFAMDVEMPDGPVTPFLNKLASEGLHFTNFYPQHSVGTSSDSEFTFNTSLFPINDGTVFITHTDREYITLPKLLRNEGYNTVSMHGNNGDFWNRNIMHKSLGYERFFSKLDYEIDEEVGLGLSDMSFFNQSIEKIKQIKEQDDSPIMATMITLTNHYPFDDVEKYGEFNVGHLEGTEIGNYLKSFHYADTALESFVSGMDEAGLLDNAVIVLYGDHHAKISKADYRKIYNYNEELETYYTADDPEYVKIDTVLNKELKRTPFIIWSKDSNLAKEIDTPMGMVDALPTVSNMLGIFNPYQLGKDIMSAENNTVIFPNEDWINKDVYYTASNGKYYSLETHEVIENEELIKVNEDVEHRILLSNNIVQNNLIKYYNGILAQNNKPKIIIDDNIS
ncbi:MAG: LTA synthase family protein [Tissierellaceae bacterium]|nr:LTA synthase family protein [Tissierellaceae bacterium]